MMLLGALGIVAVFWLYQRSFLLGVGRQALEEQPDAIELRRAPGDAWADPAAAERLAEPLREKGFVELGVYEVLPSSGFKLGVMIQEKDGVAAFLCERPNALGLSLELNVRYADGTSTMLINRADDGAPSPPFFRVIFDPSGASSGELYERLLRERSSAGVKAISAESVLADYRSAWARMAAWEKGRGLSPEEVSLIGAGAEGQIADPEGAPGRLRERFAVERDGAALQITHRWGSPAAAAFLFIVAAGWFALNRFMFSLGGPTREAAFDRAALLWALAPAAMYAYCGLAVLLNSRVIRIDPLRLTVRGGPIPWPGAKDVPTGDIDRILSEASLSHEGHGGGGRVYRVMVIRKSAEPLQLLPGASDPAQAEFIVRQLNGFLAKAR